MAFSTSTATYPTSFPVFGGTPRAGSAQIVNGSSTNTVTASNFSPASTGTRLREIRCVSGPTTAPGGTTKVAIIVNDGSNDRVIDTFAMTNSADTLQYIGRFDNEILPTGYSLKVVSRTAVTSGATLDFTFWGEDLQVGA